MDNEIILISPSASDNCGIARYNDGLSCVLSDKFGKSFTIREVSLQINNSQSNIHEHEKYGFKAGIFSEYRLLADKFNADDRIKVIVLQHDYSLFSGELGDDILVFLANLKKPLITVLHSVYTKPSLKLKLLTKRIICESDKIIVLTNQAKYDLKEYYKGNQKEIMVIPHGLYTIPMVDKQAVKTKLRLDDRYIISTFNNFSSNILIDIVIETLPLIVKERPDILYLFVGQLYSVEEDSIRMSKLNRMWEKINSLGLKDHVKFVTRVLSNDELLDYFQVTDLCLFPFTDTSQCSQKDFSYALNCPCPVISTSNFANSEMNDCARIHVTDFSSNEVLANSIKLLISDFKLYSSFMQNSKKCLQVFSWNNTAIVFAKLIMSLFETNYDLKFTVPVYSMDYLRRITVRLGLTKKLQNGQADLRSGLTLEDNAYGLIALTRHFETTGDIGDKYLMELYLNFICFCQLPNGRFANLIDQNGTRCINTRDEQNQLAEGAAIWALGEFISRSHLLHNYYLNVAEVTFLKFIQHTEKHTSIMAVALSIKGLYSYNLFKKSRIIKELITVLADNLLYHYRKSQDINWFWFDVKIGNEAGFLPEALMYAYFNNRKDSYILAAKASFDFLLNHLFVENELHVISEDNWSKKGGLKRLSEERPIDVTSVISALELFYSYFGTEMYSIKLEKAFNWFNGDNRINQVVYDPITSACYNGIKNGSMDMDQHSRPVVSYLLARCIVEKYLSKDQGNLHKENNKRIYYHLPDMLNGRVLGMKLYYT